MFQLFRPLFADARINARLLLGSLFIHFLGVVSTFYGIQVFNSYLSHGLDATLLTLTVGAILAMIMESTLRKLRLRIITALCARRDRELSEALLQKLLNAPVAVLQGLNATERTAPTRAMEQVAFATSPTNALALMDAPFALLYMFVLFFMAWPLGLVALLFTLGTVTGIYLQSVGMKEASTELQKVYAQHSAVLASAERYDTIRALNAQAMMTRRGETQGGASRLLRYRAGNRQDQMQNFLLAANTLLSIITVGLGAKLAISNVITIGGLFGASMLAARAMQLIIRPAQSASTILQGIQAMTTVEKYLALPVESADGTELAKYSGRFELKDVAFGFPGGTGPLFESLSLRIDPGRIVVVTGGNGAGKTTFARLMVGLIEPTRGNLFADGVDLRQLRPGWWRRQLVYLPQEPDLIDGTLAENLLALVPDTPEDWLKHIIEIVGLREVIDRHPKGLNMPITQGGRTLSPGIRRRIALARALTSEGRLVILDEPTEGLDPAGTILVNNLLNEMTKEGRTIVIMTQNPGDLIRVATVIDLDAKPVPRISEPENVVRALAQA